MTSTPKRRWFRFSLRTLFVVVTVAACYIGWGAWAVRSTGSYVERLAFIVGSVFLAMMLVGAFFTWVLSPMDQ